jgi:hypothetical protein
MAAAVAFSASNYANENGPYRKDFSSSVVKTVGLVRMVKARLLVSILFNFFLQ